MRALFDANVFISFLLSRAPETSSVGAILAAAAAGHFTLLFTPAIADEIRATVAGRFDLATKIGASDIEALLSGLETFAESVPRITEVLPRVGRDPKDDYLIAHAIVANADYLVSWDKDLLDLIEVGGVRIVSPPAFLRVLRASGSLPR